MMFKKRLLSLALAGVMALGFALPAAAVDASGNVGDTPVEITAEAATFSVTVPTSIVFHIDANADVTCPSNLQIINNSAAPIEVSGIEVQDGAWTMASYNDGDRSLLAAEQVGANKLGLALKPEGGSWAATSTNGTQNLLIDTAEWTVDAIGTLSFDADAIATAVKEEFTDALQAAKIVFTVGWSGDVGLSSVPDGPYLAFTSPSAFSMSVASPGWNGTLEYSTDTTTWSTWDGSSVSALADDGDYALYFRGTGNTVITGVASTSYKWTITGTDVQCRGNIENLLDYATVQAGNHPIMGNYCYTYMFCGCTSLTTAPALPATTLAGCCYSHMFYGCTSLTTAPALPATTLAASCYYYMFYGCTSLTTASALPATTLAGYCYAYMFYGCTSLTATPALPATTLASYCYSHMFYGCTSLTTAPALPATTLASYCYYYMFYNCTSLKLSATQTGEYTQAYRVPTSGTGTIATNALTDMFNGTGGTFTGTPSINTTYYLHSSNSIVG